MRNYCCDGSLKGRFALTQLYILYIYAFGDGRSLQDILPVRRLRRRAAKAKREGGNGVCVCVSKGQDNVW